MIVARSGYLRHDYLNLQSSEVVVGSHQFDPISVFFVNFFSYFMGLRGIPTSQVGVPGCTDTFASLVSFGHLKRTIGCCAFFFIIIADAVVSV